MSEAGFSCPVCATPMLHVGPGQYWCPDHGPWSYDVLPPQEHRGRAQVADLTQPKAKGPGGGGKSGRRRKREPRKGQPRPLDDGPGHRPSPPRLPRPCACGCGETFTPQHRRQVYANSTHRRREEQRRRRNRVERRRNPGQEEGA